MQATGKLKGTLKSSFCVWGGGGAGGVAEARARGGSATLCPPCRTAYAGHKALRRLRRSFLVRLQAIAVYQMGERAIFSTDNYPFGMIFVA